MLIRRRRRKIEIQQAVMEIRNVPGTESPDPSGRPSAQASAALAIERDLPGIREQPATAGLRAKREHPPPEKR